MPGPPPKHPEFRRRRNPSAPVVRLPAGGRAGEPPDWPLAGQLSIDELEVWAQVWSSPQAVMWERLDLGRLVARYVRCLVHAERPAASAALLAEVRQLEDRLGLSPMACKRLGWAVDDDAGAAAAARQVAPAAPRRSVRRLRAVDPAS